MLDLLLQDLKTGRATAAADSAEVKRLRWMLQGMGRGTAVEIAPGRVVPSGPELVDKCAMSSTFSLKAPRLKMLTRHDL